MNHDKPIQQVWEVQFLGGWKWYLAMYWALDCTGRSTIFCEYRAAASSSRSSCRLCGTPRQAAADVGRSEGAVAGEEEEGAWPLALGRRGRPAFGEAAARHVDVGGGSAGQQPRAAVQGSGGARRRAEDEDVGERRCRARARAAAAMLEDQITGHHCN